MKIIGSRLSLIKKDIIKNRHMYIFIIPALIWLIMFRYRPLYFVQIAFRDFRITRDVLDCEWVGFENFVKLFTTVGFGRAFRNTLIINFYKLVFEFPMPIIFALLLNEIKSLRFKKITQTIVYLPHFISWAIIFGISYSMLSVESGKVNEILEMLGIEPVFFLGSKQHIRGVIVITNIWKEVGWGTIIYLAAVTNINPELYEAAYVDGAKRFQRLWHITLPGIKSTVVVLLIIRLGKMLDVGFEQILVYSNDMVLSKLEVLDTFVFRIGLQQGKQSVATAAGLFNSVVAGILIYSADKFSKYVGEQGLF